MTDADPDDDATLLARHVAGEPDAFATLVARHRDRAWAVAVRTLGDPDDAADAVQEAFLSAYRNAARFRGDAAFGTWLHRIVMNACLDRARRARVRPTVPLLESAASAADPRDRLAERETANDVAAGLAQLGIDQRAAVVLVDIEGLSVDEAAEALGVPAGTVKSRCARGRARLAVLLGHLAPDQVRDAAPTADGTATASVASNPRPADEQ
ncbi:MAG: RNA polymerase sigma factor SigM [Mycobacteriales bacterium]